MCRRHACLACLLKQICDLCQSEDSHAVTVVKRFHFSVAAMPPAVKRTVDKTKKEAAPKPRMRKDKETDKETEAAPAAVPAETGPVAGKVKAKTPAAKATAKAKTTESLGRICLLRAQCCLSVLQKTTPA